MLRMNWPIKVVKECNKEEEDKKEEEEEEEKKKEEEGARHTNHFMNSRVHYVK